MIIESITNSAYQAYDSIREHAPTIAPPSQILKNIAKIVLPAIALAGMGALPVADAGIFSGIAVAAGCVGMGVIFPASLFWSAAPCYDVAMLATVNPLIP